MSLESKGFYIENKIEKLILPIINNIGFIKDEKNTFVYLKNDKKITYNYHFINNDFHELFLNVEFHKLESGGYMLLKEKEIFMEIDSTLDSLKVIDDKILKFRNKLLDYFPYEFRKIKIKKLMDKYGNENGQ